MRLYHITPANAISSGKKSDRTALLPLLIRDQEPKLLGASFQFTQKRSSAFVTGIGLQIKEYSGLAVRPVWNAQHVGDLSRVGADYAATAEADQSDRRIIQTGNRLLCRIYTDVSRPYNKKRNLTISTIARFFTGRSGEIRTRGLLNPIQARYQTALHPDSNPLIYKGFSSAACLNNSTRACLNPCFVEHYTN